MRPSNNSLGFMRVEKGRDIRVLICFLCGMVELGRRDRQNQSEGIFPVQIKAIQAFLANEPKGFI